MAALRDKRALDIAFRYAESGNAPLVRAAAVQLLGRIGADNPKTFNVIADMVNHAVVTGDTNLALAAVDALVSLGDARGLQVLEQIARNPAVTQRWKDRLPEYQEMLRRAVAGTASPGAKQP
jgi:HEAT repeat protein